MKKLSYLSCLLLILAVACEKENKPDYRNAYTGDYDFSIENEYRYTSNGGQYIHTYDTSYTYSGAIKKSLLSPYKIIVDWGTDTIRVSNTDVLMKETVLTVDTSGVLSYPEIDEEGIVSTSYIQEDTIRFTFYVNWGMAHMLYSIWYVTGIKK